MVAIAMEELVAALNAEGFRSTGRFLCGNQTL
jgi:hypothetical protein